MLTHDFECVMVFIIRVFFITRAASASVINKNENDKYHNAREFIVLTRLSHEISFFTAKQHTQNHTKPQECNTGYISTLQTIESSAKNSYHVITTTYHMIWVFFTLIYCLKSADISRIALVWFCVVLCVVLCGEKTRFASCDN